MNEWTSLSLAQIVTRDHRAATVFEKYHLDFCCKGKRSLQQACTDGSLEMEQVVADLDEACQPGSYVAPDFESFPIQALIDYILFTHHSYVKRELSLIFNYLQRVASKHGDRHPEMLRVFDIFTAVKEEMELHMQKEELILFPRIREVELQSAQGVMPTYLLSPIIIMEQEHDHAGRLMNEIRELTGNYVAPEDACTTYRLSFAALQAFEMDLHQHVHLENNILFPKALRLVGYPALVAEN